MTAVSRADDAAALENMRQPGEDQGRNLRESRCGIFTCGLAQASFIQLSCSGFFIARRSGQIRGRQDDWNWQSRNGEDVVWSVLAAAISPHLLRYLAP